MPKSGPLMVDLIAAVSILVIAATVVAACTTRRTTPMTSTYLCRCGHHELLHYGAVFTDTACLRCKCPEYRPAETPDTLTLRGTQ